MTARPGRVVLTVAAGLLTAILSVTSAWAQDMLPLPDDPAVTPAPVPASPLPPAAPALVAEKSVPGPASPDGTALFKHMDRNHDGLVTFEEFAAAYPYAFPAADDDPADASVRFGILDADKSGTVSQKEFVANFQAPVAANYVMKWIPNGARGFND